MSANFYKKMCTPSNKPDSRRQATHFFMTLLFLTKENHNEVKKIYNDEEKFIEVKDNESPVFNFHLNKILEKMKNLDELIGTNN